MKGILIIFLCCFLTVCGQVCLKIGLYKNTGFWLPHQSFFKNITNWITSPIILFGVFTYLIATVMFMYLLDRYELTYFYPWTALTYIFAFLAGIIIFNEPTSMQRILGTIIIVIGVIVISRS